METTPPLTTNVSTARTAGARSQVFNDVQPLPSVTTTPVQPLTDEQILWGPTVLGRASAAQYEAAATAPAQSLAEQALPLQE